MRERVESVCSLNLRREREREREEGGGMDEWMDEGRRKIFAEQHIQ